MVLRGMAGGRLGCLGKTCLGVGREKIVSGEVLRCEAWSWCVQKAFECEWALSLAKGSDKAGVLLGGDPV